MTLALALVTPMRWDTTSMSLNLVTHPLNKIANADLLNIAIY